MLTTLKSFIDRLATCTPDTTQRPHDLQLATAVLLVEIMCADREIGEGERESVLAALRRQFALDESDLAALLELAHAEAEEAYDYQRFTSILVRALGLAERVQVVENLWRVAYADGHLSAHELHVMRKLADLLYVGHGDYVNAKMRAKDAVLGAGAPG